MLCWPSWAARSSSRFGRDDRRQLVRLAGVAYLLGVAALMVALTLLIVLGIPVNLLTTVSTGAVIFAASWLLGRRRRTQLVRGATEPECSCRCGAPPSSLCSRSLSRGRLSQGSAPGVDRVRRLGLVGSREPKRSTTSATSIRTSSPPFRAAPTRLACRRCSPRACTRSDPRMSSRCICSTGSSGLASSRPSSASLRRG